LTLGQRERLRAAALVARIERVEAVAMKLWMTSRTVSGSVNTTSLIAGGDMPYAESRTICARRHVYDRPARATHDPQQPLALVVAYLPQRHPGRHDNHSLDTMSMPRNSASPPRLLGYANPANVPGHTTTSPDRAGVAVGGGA